MCGIAGVMRFDGAEAEPKLLQGMARMLHHRGPDGNGTYREQNVGLVHTRLSIIDLAGGHQPMSNGDRSLWITFNGEIFNYLELREELIQKGHRFATQSDTEVILHLFEEKGEDCVSHLNGQWAFAIWDVRKQRLFLSRDRLGVRPLYYTMTDQAFFFGSEIKAIFACPEVSRELDTQALDQVFTFWFPLPPRTIFKNVLEVPPGHSMTVAKGERKLLPYWGLDYSQEAQLGDPQPEQDCADQLLALLADATRLRLRADVPVGAYLSGGLDSTVTTALIKNLDGRLRTFSVSFDDAGFDESAYQQEASRYLGTDHQEMRCSTADIAAHFPEVVWHAEKPILRTAPVPLYLLAKLVRDSGYKVVLTGEGSDEMLGGYDIFKEAKIRRFCGAHPESKWRPLLLRRLYPYLPDVQRQSVAYLQAFFRSRPEDLSSPFFSHLPRWRLTSGLKLFFSAETNSQLRSSNPCSEMQEQLPASYAGWDGFSQAQYLEARYLLPGYILSSQGDRMAMAHGVECRFPFLDHRVVEFASTLHPHLKMKVLNEKYLLKRCVKGLIPPSVGKRSKQPYRAPEARSFFNGLRPDYVGELLSARRIRQDGIFDPGTVERLVTNFSQGAAAGAKDNMALTGILSTQLVADQFIRSFPTI
jgi:asparagine synthase (glutamine-hydrolysing)